MSQLDRTKWAKQAALKPESMLTTATPWAQELIMVRSGANPPKLAPYPLLAGTAITGLAIKPAKTLGNAPSIPAMQMTTFAFSISRK